METTENLPTEPKKPQPSTHVTTAQWVSKMKLTFANATLPEIFGVMQTVGYSAEKIDAMKDKVVHLETLQQMQTKEYAEQFSESQKFDTKRSEIDAAFTKNRELMKILFKGNIHAQSILMLDKTKPRTYAQWYEMVTNFYAQLEASPELLTKAVAININAAAISAQKLAIAELQALKVGQRKETAEAQTATDSRDKAFDELYPLYSEYIQYAKVLLQDNQALEAIGIKV